MTNISEQTQKYIKDLSRSVQEHHAYTTPLTASLQINKWCNSMCKYCGIWKNAKNNPPIEDIKLAIDELSELGVHMISLTGGEPFLHNQMPEVVSHMKARGVISSSMTNGLLLTPRKVVPILEAGLNSLCVSLDTIDSDTYTRIRGVPLKPVLKGLEYVSNIRREFKAFFVFSINCVISKQNIDQIPALVEFCSSLDISMGFQPLHNSFESRYNPAELQFNEDDLPHIRSQINHLIKMKQNGFRIDNDIEYLLGFPEFLVYKQMPKGTVCTAGYTTISIDNELNVRSCWPMKIIGNLHDCKLIELWHSSIYNARRLSMLKLECPKCWLRCHTDYLSVLWVKNLLEKIAIMKSSSQPVQSEI